MVFTHTPTYIHYQRILLLPIVKHLLKSNSNRYSRIEWCDLSRFHVCVFVCVCLFSFSMFLHGLIVLLFLSRYMTILILVFSLVFLNIVASRERLSCSIAWFCFLKLLVLSTTVLGGGGGDDFLIILSKRSLPLYGSLLLLHCGLSGRRKGLCMYNRVNNIYSNRNYPLQ